MTVIGRLIPVVKGHPFFPTEGLFLFPVHAISSQQHGLVDPLWYGSLLRGTSRPSREPKDGGSLLTNRPKLHTLDLLVKMFPLKYNYILGKYQWSGQRSLGHATALGPPPVGCLW